MDSIPFRPVPIALGACAVLAVLVVLSLIDPARGRTWARRLLVLPIAGILMVTLLGPPTGTGIPNLVPGRTIVEEFTHLDHPLGVFNVVGNLALFGPLGWLLALATTRRRIVPAAVVGFGLSAAIELVQSFIGRVADIDDVILNGTGAVLGACVAMLISRARS